MHTWVEISKSALRSNISNLTSLLADEVKLMAVVKSNAYGHGLVEVSRVIQDNVNYLAVINIEEARKLRENDIHVPILVLGRVDDPDEIEWALAERVEITIADKAHAEKLSKILNKNSRKNEFLRVHAIIDTGMGRMGVLPQDALDLISYLRGVHGITIKGVMSHFADVAGHGKHTQTQLQRFQDVKFQLYKESFSPGNLKSGLAQNFIWHTAKTEAVLTLPESRMDAARVGLGLYGLWPDIRIKNKTQALNPDFNLQPVLSWKAKIAQIKEYPEGEYVGYGCTHKTKRKTRIAVIPAGYYEGYDRRFSNKGEVLIGTEKCPVIGNVCMNMFMVEVTKAAGVKTGDEAVIIGSSKGKQITADEAAKKIKTINYEIATSINPLIKRIIVD